MTGPNEKKAAIKDLVTGLSPGASFVPGTALTWSYSATGDNIVGIAYGFDAGVGLAVIPGSVNQIIQHKVDSRLEQLANGERIVDV